MANVKNLKKDIRYVLGDIIDMCYVWEFLHPKENGKKANEIVEKALLTFDELLEKVNQGRKAENKKAHYKSIQKELEEKASELIGEINQL
ncbi:MAG: hypothetical protein KGV44_12870 [Flavobacteriaceae bacterium]|nr:hypothetical protein [Flavobacteriaceae bacterium]